MLKIIADENIPGVEQAFAALGTVEAVSGRELCSAQLKGADVLLVRSVTPVNEALLAGTAVKFVGSATAGLDHVDRQYLQREGIRFASAPGANANSVVEYVLSGIAATGDYLESLLAGGRVGIAGYGMVGQLLEKRLESLGIDSCVYDPWLEPSILPHNADFGEVLDSDVICLHTSLTDEQPWPSRHLLGMAQLQQIRADALLINASRGEVIDNQALRQMLLDGEGPQVILDVWEGEPELDVQLLGHVAIGTAHIAGYSHDGKIRATSMLLDACTAQFDLQGQVSAVQLPGSEDIHLPASATAAATIRHLLQQRYDIRYDDELLRQAAGDQERPLAAAFDQLRRNYRVRHELSGSRVLAERASSEQMSIASALGCIVESGEA